MVHNPDNKLAGQTSPYLLQHADNPVNWLPWSEEALNQACSENKPILLSIGYSSCHWCHVMAHESFEDADTAEVMNRLFINIKVDREERPDLDKIYQLALQMITQRHGGWPLTMFLNPHNLVPFYGGTYFPRQPRYGLPAFTDLMVQVANYYHKHQEDIIEQNEHLLRAFDSLTLDSQPAATLNAAPLDTARQQLEKAFDRQHGGFSEAPKFPHPSHIDRLLRRYVMSRKQGQADDEALLMASVTLVKMALGGIYDQLGGGFCRYSVDEFWMIPHFEKMLYDNAQLLPLYAEAYAVTGNELFRRVVSETAAWLTRDMQSPDGGYYSSLDADSEGEEGKYYAWDPDEVRTLLNEENHQLLIRRFGLDQPANFEGRWHLFVNRDIASLADEFSLPEEDISRHIDAARATLLEARQRRMPPGRDEKILTSWNALMIRGMAIAARYTDDPSLIHSAQQALTTIQKTLWRDGRLLATGKDGNAHLNAYLDDYAFLIDALLELLQLRWDSGDLEFATELADAMLRHFCDAGAGGFFFTADDHEQLIHRPKPFGDDALPAGNGVAARVLLRLGYLLGNTAYIDAAEKTLQAAWTAVSQVPYAHDSLLNALEDYLNPPQILVLRGEAGELGDWHRQLLSDYQPGRLVFAIAAGTSDLPAVLAAKKARGKRVAYLCNGHQCSEPVDNLEELLANS